MFLRGANVGGTHKGDGTHLSFLCVFPCVVVFLSCFAMLYSVFFFCFVPSSLFVRSPFRYVSSFSLVMSLLFFVCPLTFSSSFYSLLFSLWFCSCFFFVSPLTFSSYFSFSLSLFFLSFVYSLTFSSFFSTSYSSTK